MLAAIGSRELGPSEIQRAEFSMAEDDTIAATALTNSRGRRYSSVESPDSLSNNWAKRSVASVSRVAACRRSLSTVESTCCPDQAKKHFVTSPERDITSARQYSSAALRSTRLRQPPLQFLSQGFGNTREEFVPGHLVQHDSPQFRQPLRQVPVVRRLEPGQHGATLKRVHRQQIFQQFIVAPGARR